MANERLCVFCGEKLGLFQFTEILCAGTLQPSCRTCAKELNDLREVERCRRALRLGLAHSTEKLEALVDASDKAEEGRPVCLRCGTKMKFKTVQYLDNSPLRDGLPNTVFEVLPAYCPSCGKYEFYDPDIVKQDPLLACLVRDDTGKSYVL